MNKKRTIFVASLLVLGFLVVIYRLISLQLATKDELKRLIERQYYTKKYILLPRGTIFDQNGRILGISIPRLTVYAIPKYIKDKERLSEELAKILNIPKNVIYKKLQQNENYVVISDDVDKSLRKQLERLRRKLKEWNLGILENTKRFYPYNEVAGSTIGFVNKYTGIGVAGLEYKYNHLLGGGKGKILLFKDAIGNPITIIDKEYHTENYNDIYITINSDLQFIAEDVLKKYVKLRKPIEALILIVDPNTGKILANATYPNYNPNIYWKFRNHKNITFQNAYEPGSLVKPFILAQAIEKGVIDLNEKINCGYGKIIIDGVKIKDHSWFGDLTPEDIIVYSSNVGIIKIALMLDPDDIYKKLKELGFGKSTGTFPAEASGILKERKRPVDIAYTAIGQSWTATAIQIAMAYSAIANGGYLIKPMIMIKSVDKRTGKIKYVEKKIIRRVFQPETTRILKQILTQVVERGTAKKGKSEYFTIAGKTGTAQKYDPLTKSLSTTRYYTWFAGFFPADKPKYTVVIFFNEPEKIDEKEIIGGGTVSAPVLNDLVERLMFYEKEKPDKVKDEIERIIEEKQKKYGE